MSAGAAGTGAAAAVLAGAVGIGTAVFAGAIGTAVLAEAIGTAAGLSPVAVPGVSRLAVVADSPEA
jgi:hypothetical protein